MIKTIATFTQTTSDLVLQEILDPILNQIATWQTEGKHTGEINATHNIATGARYCSRWAWIDNDAAEAYKNLIVSTWINLYPDINVDIVVE